MCRPYTITTSIPYVNARPHIGFAMELVQADAFARYRRLLGHPVRLQTGADENAQKNAIAAREAGVETQAFVDANTEAFRALGDALNISADDFIRTTEPRHRRAVERLWRSLTPGDVYRKAYRGLYCVGCEDFVLERQLVEGRCADHGAPPVVVEEENCFFRLSAYKNQLEQLIAGDVIRVTPHSRKNEVLAFIRQGLQDISISRVAARSDGWGIPVPGDPSQVVYVWIDALVNYLSSAGYAEGDGWKQHWSDEVQRVHIIGKNVWKFHAVYWPALLLSAGLPLPSEVVVHGFVTENGRKISKSLGNTIDPFQCVEAYGADAVRYTLLRYIPAFGDGDFSKERLRAAYNADLANGLGNLVSRLAGLCVRAGHGGLQSGDAPQAPCGYHEAMEGYEYPRELDALWSVIDQVNGEVNREEPWRLVGGPKAPRLLDLLDRWLGQVHRIAWWLAPFLPHTAERVEQSIRNPSEAAPMFPRVA